MDIRTIVYHQSYGFGIVINKDKEIADVYFYNDNRRTKIVEHFLELINQNRIDYFVESRFENNFNFQTKMRAQDYQNRGKVRNIEYTEKYFKAKVAGSETYETLINFSRNGYLFECDCPVGRNCKHACALCYELRAIFTALNNYYDKVGDKKMDFDEHLLDAYTKIEKHINVLENTLIVIDDLLSKDDQYLLRFIDYVDKTDDNRYTYLRSKEEKMIYYVLAYNDELRERISSLIKYDYFPARDLIKYLKRADNIYRAYGFYGNNVLSETQYKYVTLYFICNKLFDEYLDFSTDDDNDDYVSDEAVDFCCRKVEYSEALANKIMNARHSHLAAYSYFINNLLSKEEKLAFLLNPNSDYPYSYDEIKDYDVKNRLELLRRAIIDEKDVANILANEMVSARSDDKTAAAILLNIFNNIEKNSVRKSIIKEAKKLADAQYFVEYLENKEEGFKDTGFHFRWYGPEHVLQNKENDEPDINVAAFLKYFKLSFDGFRDDDDVIFKFYVNDLLAERVVGITERNDTKEVYQNLFSKNYESEHAYFTIWYCKHVLKEKYDQARQAIVDEIEEEKEELLCSRALDDMRVISDKYIATSLRLRENKKAHLEYNIDLSNSPTLSLKLGIDKMYIVKDGQQFLRNFTSNEVVSYGKNLSFCHTLDNLEDADRKIVDYLIKTQPNVYRERKYFALNVVMLAQLLTFLVGHKITIDDNEYFVRLEDIHPDIKIDETYHIHCSFSDTKKYRYFKDMNRAFIIDEDHKRIDVYNAPNSEIELFDFAAKYNGLRIKKIAEEFKSNLFFHFNNKIDIAENLKSEFKISVVNTKAYFDYEDKTIKLRREYYKDEKKISTKEFDDNDKLKINTFEQYLSSIGFVDDMIVDDSKVLAFFYMDLEELKKLCEIYLSESVTNKQVSVFAPAKIRISYDGVVMKALLEGSKYSNEELEAIMKALKHKKKYVLLANNTIIDLDNKVSNDFYATIDDLKLNAKALNDESRITLVQSLKALAHQENCTIDDYLQKMMNEISDFKNSQEVVPPINGELRQYQIDGYKWLKILSKYNIGGILADDMGLGKTLEIITLIESSKEQKPSIIICPKTLVFNWKNEFMRFAPRAEVKEISGSKEERDKVIKNIKAKKKCVYISSYDSFRNDLDEYKVAFEYAVLDEAQYIKNVNALKTISVKKINADHKFALTGTPIENNLLDLWSIFDFVMPGYFENLNTFKSNYNDDNFIQMISKRVAPFVLRRVKQDVLKDLPEKYETILSVDMPDSQRKLYDAFKNEVNQKLESGSKAFDVLPYLTRLRQICVNPKMFVDDYHGEVAKMSLLENLIVDYLEKGHKLIIFSQFVKALNEIEELLNIKKLPYFIITGKTDGEERINIANKFNNESAEKILLVSLKAGGTGLNLIGADTVVHLDPWWNVAAENQASDRAYRIGQKRNIEVIKIICANSIEQRVIELQNVKKDLIDKVIANNDESIITSSLENIKYLLDE